jgi:hypothetical protein
VVQFEARTGVIGSLKLLFDDMVTLENSKGQISVDEAARRIKRLREDAELLVENVKDPNDHDAVESEVPLPDPSIAPFVYLSGSSRLQWSIRRNAKRTSYGCGHSRER